MFFSLADVTQNGSLSRAEIGRLARLVVYASTMTDSELVTDEDMWQKLAGASAIGVGAAQLMIWAVDYDNSDEISFDELMGGRWPPPDLSSVPTASAPKSMPHREKLAKTIKDFEENLKIILPFLKELLDGS